VEQHQAEHCKAFFQTNAILWKESNGNFWRLIGILAKFNPATQQCVQFITSKEIYYLYTDSRFKIKYSKL
jgi:hypothetical protein